jgi:hypothetical protein
VLCSEPRADRLCLREQPSCLLWKHHAACCSIWNQALADRGGAVADAELVLSQPINVLVRKLPKPVRLTNSPTLVGLAVPAFPVDRERYQNHQIRDPDLLAPAGVPAENVIGAEF